MTLVEILISLAIIAGMIGFVVSVVGTSGNNMRRASNNIIKLVKFVYDQAALTNSYYRIVFNLEEKQYYVEYSDEPFYVVKEGDETELIRKKNEEKSQKGINENPDAPVTTTAAAVGSFAELEDDDLVEINELPDNIKFADVYIMHQADKITDGKAYLYFFPKGNTEFAVIHLSDNDEENFMTLIVNPLTGKVEVETEYLEHEEILENINKSRTEE